MFPYAYTLKKTFQSGKEVIGNIGVASPKIFGEAKCLILGE